MPQLRIEHDISRDAENRQLREVLVRLTEEARLSKEASDRCHQREISLLAAENLPDLLTALTDGMQRSFRLPCINLVLYDPEHVLRHLLISTGHLPEKFWNILFLDRISDAAPCYRSLSRPWLGPFRESAHRALFPGSDPIRSVALLPLIRYDMLIGSLNLGSRDPSRFTGDHASDFLHRLATIGAVCLENTTNREHLVVSGLTDALTGMHNRRYLDRRLSEEVARARRYRQPLSCLFIDADHFKRVNDLHGHSAGDRVLREISLRVKECLRASDVAARFGGEEFALLLPQTDLDEAAQLAERIRAKIERDPIALNDQAGLGVTISIGVSELSTSVPGNPGERLLADADAALYQAKRQGRNRVSVQSQVPAE